MKKNKIFKTVRTFVASLLHFTGNDINTIKNDDKLVNDLALDSLSIISLHLYIENIMQVNIPDEKMYKQDLTISKIVEHILNTDHQLAKIC